MARGQVADAARARRSADPARRGLLRDDHHAAYQPQRAVRTTGWKYIRRFDDYPHPVLANCDDSATKEVLVEAGWGEQTVAPEELYDLVLDPNEGRNLAAEPVHEDVLAELRSRLEEWMVERDDPLLRGPVEPPPGAAVNDRDQISPNEPTRVFSADPTGATSR